MAVSAGQEEGTVNLRVYGVAAHRIIHRTALAGNDPTFMEDHFCSPLLFSLDFDINYYSCIRTGQKHKEPLSQRIF